MNTNENAATDSVSSISLLECEREFERRIEYVIEQIHSAKKLVKAHSDYAHAYDEIQKARTQLELCAFDLTHLAV